MTQPATAALEEPWARGLLGRARRNSWLEIVGGLALFILVGVFANLFAGNSDHLRASGGQTSGVIAQLRGFSPTADTSALVDYTVEGRHFEKQVDLGNRIRNYRAGQSVTVYYDVEHPATMTIDDINNEPAWTVLPMAIAFVASLCFMAYGVGTLLSTRRKRHLLGRLPWHDAELLGVRRNGLYVSLGDGRLVRAVRSANAPTPDPGSRARTVSEDKRTLVALGEQPTELINARPPRSVHEEQLWRRLLDKPVEP